MNKKYAFLGVGNMASAIISGLPSEQICLYDKDSSKYECFSGTRFDIAQSAAAALSHADRIIFSVKPQNLPELAEELRECGTMLRDKVYISIMAGVTIENICKSLGMEVPVIRTMPNTPLMIGKGVTALSRNELVSDEDFEDVTALFGELGKTLVLPEDKLNAIISVTSSAPAYVYLFVKSIIEGAVRQGFENDHELLELVCAMVEGSVGMMCQSDKTPDELIRMVTSPGGTTERALDVMNRRGFSDIVTDAMLACTKRADELSGR